MERLALTAIGEPLQLDDGMAIERFRWVSGLMRDGFAGNRPEYVDSIVLVQLVYIGASSPRLT